MADVVNLFEYLPSFIAEYREMRLLLEAEQPEFQTFADETERILDEQFIRTAGVDGIARFEAILGILPSIYDTLEIRRTRVLTRWNDTIPYTVKTLKSKISAIQGNNDIEITIAGYEITIVTKCEKRGQIDDLEALLKVIIPCNLNVIAENKIIGQTVGTANYAMGGSPTDTIVLTNDLTGDYATAGQAVVAFSPVPTDTIYLTNDLNEHVPVNLTGGFAGGVVPTDFILLTNDLTGEFAIRGNAIAGASLSDTGIISI
ncbi:MAG: putative phage tail protein [Kiritimatiellia bacterium]